MKTTMSLKLDSDVKQQAADVARQLGLSLSAIINADLKQLIKTREVTFSAVPRMTPYLENAIKVAREDHAAGKLKTYDSFKDMFADLDKL